MDRQKMYNYKFCRLLYSMLNEAFILGTLNQSHGKLVVLKVFYNSA